MMLLLSPYSSCKHLKVPWQRGGIKIRVHIQGLPGYYVHHQYVVSDHIDVGSTKYKLPLEDDEEKALSHQDAMTLEVKLEFYEM